jgi:dihydroxynaphthoic acid synthetase
MTPPTEYRDILFERREGVATITINRPDCLNALRMQTAAELIDAFRRADADRSVGVVVLRGAGTRAFCVGGDQKELVSTLDESGWRVFARELRTVFQTMRDLGKPIVAAVRGWCIGGGHELHCFADLTLADEGARFGQVGAKVGGAPIFVTQLLPRLVGEKKAREILYLCRQYTAQEAKELGLINFVASADSFEQSLASLCDELLAKSPTVLRAMKRGVNTVDVLGDDVIPLMVESLAGFFGTPEQREATNAFAERRAPDFMKFRTQHG